MEGAHKSGRAASGVVVGDRSTATAQRQRAQQGAAASGRIGQAVRLERATKSAKRKAKDAAIGNEVARAMKQGQALVQGAVEHLTRCSGRTSPPEIATWEEEDDIPCGEEDFVASYEAALAAEDEAELAKAALEPEEGSDDEL